MKDYKTQFFRLALDCQALRFGSFQLKSGRQSPYFFNAGAFDHGRAISGLADCYRAALEDAGLAFDMLFGPAYKGIPLATAVASRFWEHGQNNLPFAFDRKEEKRHGEGGRLVGAPLSGRVLILDDVISAGTSIRQAVGLIRAQGAALAGVAIALDRQERGTGKRSALDEVSSDFGVPVIAVASLDDLIDFLQQQPDQAAVDIEAMNNYRAQYGV